MESSIFIHGGPGLRDYLRPHFEHQVPHSHFYDQSFGSSSIEDYVEELSLKVQQHSAAHLVCHSWGGVIALEYLKLRNPSSILSLTLISVPLSFRCENDFQEACKAQNLSNPNLEEIFLSKAERSSAQMKAELNRIFSHFESQALVKIANYFQSFDHLDYLQNCKIPVQLISGSNDLRVPFEKQKKYAKSLQLPIFEVREAGHFPFLFPSDSQYVSGLLLRFFKDHKNARP